jgi:mRNA-degrading endonuclease toxin of MazEF toxin-antitoxin module
MVWVVPLTSRIKAMHLPVHVIIKQDELNGLKCDSVALIESMLYIPKNCLGNKMGRIASMYYPLIGKAIRSQFPMSDYCDNTYAALATA